MITIIEDRMHIAALPAFLTFTFITAFTPGPNNILALSCTGRHGLRRSYRILFGIGTGFFCVMLLCGTISLTLGSLSASFVTAMKYIGCAYMVWLAWKIASAPPPQEVEEATETRFLRGFILQFVNVKIMIYGVTAFAGFLLPYTLSRSFALLFALVLTFIGCGGVLCWALAGTAFRKFFTRHARVANLTMGILLLLCACSLLA